MSMTLFLRQFPFILSLFIFIAAPFSIAQPAPSANAWQPLEVLDSLHSVDEVASRQIDDLKNRGLIVKEIEIYHVDGKGEDPAELEAYLRWYARSFMRKVKQPNGERKYVTVEFKIHRVTQHEFDSMMEQYAQAAEPKEEEIYQTLAYEFSNNFPPVSKKTFRQKYDEAIAKMRNFFGLAGGVSWAFYKAEWTKRAKKEKLLEGAIAVAKTVVLSSLLINRLMVEDPTGTHVNIGLGVLGLAVPQLFFDYWQQGNADFKGQGLNVNTQTGKITTNQPFYYLIAFLHSLAMRQLIGALSRFTRYGVEVGVEEFRAALEVTLIGLFAKGPVEVHLQKEKHKHGKWWFIGRLTAWGLFLASLQILDQFTKKNGHMGFGEYVRYIFATFGGIGALYKIYQERFSIHEGFKNLFQRLIGQYKPPARNCGSFLIFKVDKGDRALFKEQPALLPAK